MNTPKYIQNANCVLERLAAEPDRTWHGTQRELGDALGIPQPELSSLLKMLRAQERVVHGAPIPGRGRMHKLVLVDDTPLVGAVPREPRPMLLQEGDELTGAVSLADLTSEKIGIAVLRILRKHWDDEERYLRVRNELTENIRTLKDQLSHERQLRISMATDRDRMEREIEELGGQLQALRGEANQLMMRAQERRSVPVSEILDEDSMKELSRMITEKPGDYRTTDAEAGVV